MKTHTGVPALCHSQGPRAVCPLLYLSAVLLRVKLSLCNPGLQHSHLHHQCQHHWKHCGTNKQTQVGTRSLLLDSRFGAEVLATANHHDVERKTLKLVAEQGA